MICVLLMFTLPSSAMARFGMTSCQHGPSSAAGANHQHGAMADHMRAMALTTVSVSMGVFLHGEHHQPWDHGPNKPPLPCSTLCAMACALVYAPPFEVQTPQPLALSDHPASVTQRELSDAPSGKPFRPPIFLST